LNLNYWIFGISKITSKERSATKTQTVVTMCYMAPENFNENDDEEEVDEELREEVKPKLNDINEKVDIWAFGCIVHELISGEKPWSNKVKSDSKILALLFKKIPFTISNTIQKDSKIRKLIESCVKVDPKERANIKKVKFALQEILFDEVKLTLHFDHSRVDFSDGILNIYKHFENINNTHKFHLLINLEMNLFDYLRSLATAKLIPNKCNNCKKKRTS